MKGSCREVGRNIRRDRIISAGGDDNGACFCGKIVVKLYHLENPRCFSTEVDVMNSVTCTSAELLVKVKSIEHQQMNPVPHSRGSVRPIWSNGVYDDPGRLDDLLDVIFIGNINLDESNIVVRQPE